MLKIIVISWLLILSMAVGTLNTRINQMRVELGLNAVVEDAQDKK